MICPHCGHLNLPGSDSCERCVLDLAPLDKPAGQNRIEKSLLENQVADLTLRPPVTVPRGTSVHDAMRTMVATGVGAVMVVDESEKLIGIFTERDLLRRVAGLHDDLKAVRV